MLDLDRIIIDKISILVTKTFIWASRLSYEDSANAVIIIVLLIQLTLTSMRFDEVSSTLVSYFLNFFVQIFLSFKVAKFPVLERAIFLFAAMKKEHLPLRARNKITLLQFLIAHVKKRARLFLFSQGGY